MITINIYKNLIRIFAGISIILCLVIYNLSKNITTQEYLLILFFLLILLFFINETKWEYPGIIIFTVLFSFLIKSFIGFNNHTKNYHIFPDSLKYIEEINIIISSSMKIEDVILTIGSLHFGYHYFLIIFSLLFNNSFSFIMGNILLFSIGSLLFYKLINIDFGKRIAFITTFLLLISTNMTLFSVNILKDILVMFLIILSLYLYKKNKIVIPIIICILLFTIRIYAGASLIIALVLDIILIKKIKINKKIYLLISLVISFVAVSYLSVFDYFFANISTFFSNFSLIEIVLSPIRAILKFYFSPLFWNIINGEEGYIILVFDSLFFLFFSFSLILLIVKLIKYRAMRNKILVYLILIVVHAVALGLEYGGASDRQRIGIFGMLILSYVVGIFYKEEIEIQEK